MRDRVGAYRILRLLGEGGMGSVFEAQHEQLERRAAIKLLRPEYSQDPQIAARFFNEARAVNLVRHGGLVDVYEVGTLPDGAAYIVMEFLDGESLGARLRRGALAVEDAVRIARQVASALAAVHGRGIVHRDLKPDNVMIVRDPEVRGGERAKVVDFGIAKLALEMKVADQRTRTGVVMGTPRYMAPEQCRGAGAVDEKADVYALGVMLYEMLAGQAPFSAEGAGELMAQHIYEAPPPLAARAPATPPPLLALVERMLAKAPAERPAMAQVAAALEALSAPEARPSRALAATVPAPIAAALPSTLGGAAGERFTAPPPPPRRVPAALLVLIGGGLAAAGGLGLWHLRTPPAPPPPTVSAPARTVHWAVTSDPADAEVRRADTGELLGRTPWQRVQPEGHGVVPIAVAAPGRVEARLALDLARDEIRHQELAPLPTPPAATPPPAPGPRRTNRRRNDDEDVQLVH